MVVWKKTLPSNGTAGVAKKFLGNANADGGWCGCRESGLLVVTASNLEVITKPVQVELKGERKKKTKKKFRR